MPRAVPSTSAMRAGRTLVLEAPRQPETLVQAARGRARPLVTALAKELALDSSRLRPDGPGDSSCCTPSRPCSP